MSVPPTSRTSLAQALDTRGGRYIFRPFSSSFRLSRPTPCAINSDQARHDYLRMPLRFTRPLKLDKCQCHWSDFDLVLTRCQETIVPHNGPLSREFYSLSKCSSVDNTKTLKNLAVAETFGFPCR
ncbi:uncharacterized protein UTRI_03377 [Ustilago trichophora]|uniref:Uncharacterized protein n=1 Tax=Ustilago trichophora TaxID=86804 RepID=A0A5C3E3V8_9BASI|nr:uncharacterized protein UTRI_03377 [Ustilago trichophora]